MLPAPRPAGISDRTHAMHCAFPLALRGAGNAAAGAVAIVLLMLVGAIAPAVLLYVFVAYAWKGQTLGMAVMQLLVIR